jgi:hypothetical protein
LELEHLNFALRTSIANSTKAAEIAQFLRGLVPAAVERSVISRV